MRHRKGNTPKCYECFYYSEKQADEANKLDGWCKHPYHLTHGINGRKRENPLERIATRSGSECTWWEDMEDRTTHYEVMTASTVAKISVDANQQKYINNSDCATQRKEQEIILKEDTK